ncbi:MAG: UDP-forming cellulose synthase catalytic subunit [Burkholderiales bacterium]|nr:UDP-forming cellulose synthase catalytic subunit [Burkholderiales bacterium]
MKSKTIPRYEYGPINELAGRLLEWEGWTSRVTRLVAVAAGVLLLVVVVIVPLDLAWQSLFAAGMFACALYLRRYAGSLVTLVMIVMSVAVSSRYIYWRATETLGSGDNVDLAFGIVLLGAELYAWLVLLLGFFQTVWPLRRKPVPMPEDIALWPTVDVFIPTYNEPLDVVRSTVLAALTLDWPEDRIAIYILDDGRREDFRNFSKEAGVGYITRPDNRHAKAGNINHALGVTHGEYVAIFDCDHMPTRSFLQLAMGWFLVDDKLAMIQTPHHFLSPDPFERNLGTFRSVPNEGELFYGLIQDGNDLWNATFFCGSCAILRRNALLEVGGVAVDTVTEDAHTALRLHRLGYNTAYLSIRQAAGLATESLSAHVGQRIRWARGMAQIFRIDNPLLGKGLSFAQRLCYSNAMLHFFYGFPRIIFLVAPLSYLFFQAHIIHAQAILIAAYALPHLAHANITNSRLQGAFRHSFWAEIYESTLAWYIFRPTLMALINPRLGKFNVTAKGGLIAQDYFDWQITKPYLVLIGLNLAGFAIGMGRLLWWNTFETGTVVLNLIWTFYNLTLLFATLAVALEKKQIRRSHRVNLRIRAAVRLPSGRTIACHTDNYSEGGLALVLPVSVDLPVGEKIWVSLYRGENEHAFPMTVTYSREGALRGQFEALTLEQEKALVDFTLARADAWTDWEESRDVDHIMAGFREIGISAGKGAVGLLKSIVAEIRKAGPKAGKAHKSGGALLLALSLAGSLHDVRAQDAMEAPKAQFIKALTLKQLGLRQPMELRGVDGSQSFVFSIRGDEVVTGAKLKLGYAYSPSLIPELSHLKVMVNGTVVAVIPLPREGASGAVREIPIDTRLLQDYNRVSLQLIGHYTTQCEDPLHSSLWASIGNLSELDLDVSRLNVQNDLSYLPNPFFDKRDSSQLVLPMVFSGQPQPATLQAAGTVASWFGMLANYRGARFPAMLNALPQGNAVVFATTGDAPSGLVLPRMDGATLAIVDNPNNPLAKLLLVMGRDPAELARAAQALTLGGVTLTGGSVLISSLKDVPPRQPYDAPRWLPSDRPVHFGELAPASDLQVAGLVPDLIRVNFRVSPDIFTWHSKGVPVDIKFRYTPQQSPTKSTLNININDEFVRSVPLGRKMSGELSEEVMLPVLQKGLVTTRQVLFIPPYQVGADNQLQFHYYFEYRKEGECRDAILDNLRGAVDPDSTLDFSKFPHYAAMPNLAYFANAGFPYTRLADLAETAFVMPERPSPAEIETYLTLLGHMGNSTGYPATRMAVVRAEEADNLKERDIIVIGTRADAPLLKSWTQYMPFGMLDGQRRVNLPSPFQRLLARWEGRDIDENTRKAGELVLQGSGMLGAVMAFESPVDKGRSVVVITGDNDASLLNAAKPFYDAEKIRKIQGDLVLVNGSDLGGFTIGPTYNVGHLPLFTRIIWFLSGQPLLLMFLVLTSGFLISTVFYRALKRRAAARLKRD